MLKYAFDHLSFIKKLFLSFIFFSIYQNELLLFQLICV